MRNTTIIALALTSLFIFMSCSEDEIDVSPIAPQAEGDWTDPRDGDSYHWVRYDGLDWMAENFRYDLHDDSKCYIYLDADEHEDNITSTRNLPVYGRLYTHPAALEACPEGWRLPSDSDWKRLERALGMSAAEADALDWRGTIARRMLTTLNDTSALSLRLGGYFTLHTIMSTSGFRFRGAWGFYWTSTPDETKNGEYYFYRKLAYNRDEVRRESMEPVNQMCSVRYVRDAQ